MPPRLADPLAAIFARARRDGDCLLLTTSLHPKGYAHVRVGGVTFRAHRWVYERLYGIPEGADVHHRCDRRNCVEPTHLAAVDPRRHRRDAALARWHRGAV